MITRRDDPVEIALSAPIATDEGVVSAITLRPPTMRDIRVAGAPVLVGHGGRVVGMDSAAAARLVARLADVPLPVIDRLPAADFQQLADAAAGFLRGCAPSDLVRAAFALGRFFNDVGELMDLTLPELVDAAREAAALAKAEARR